jgi:hypothetical protein
MVRRAAWAAAARCARSRWRALRVSDFAQTAAVQAGIVLPRGAWDRSLVLLETPPVPASHYIHPEFGFFCPTPRFRRRLRVALACLVVAGVGATMMATADGLKWAAAVTRAGEASIAATSPATSLAPFAAVVPRLPIVAGAQTTADKPSCVGDTRTAAPLQRRAVAQTADEVICAPERASSE